LAKEVLTKPSDKLTGVPEARAQETSPANQSSHSRVIQLQGVLGNRKVAELMRLREITLGGELKPIQRRATNATPGRSLPLSAGAPRDPEPETYSESEEIGQKGSRHAVGQEEILQRSPAVADANAPTTLSGTAPASASSTPGALRTGSSATPGSQTAPNSSTPPSSAGSRPPAGSSSPLPQDPAQTSATKQSVTASGTTSVANAAALQSAVPAPAAGAANPAPSTQSATSASAVGGSVGEPGKSTATVSGAKLDTTSETGLLASLAAVPASAFGGALGQATVAASGIKAKQKSDLAASLPEIDQPTGLPVRGEEKPAPGTALQPGRAPAPEPAGPAGGAPKASAAASPAASGPLPATHVSTAAAEPTDDSGGSWWDWLSNKVKNFVGGLPTSDPSLSTSAGPRPNVDLTGDADPGRNAAYQQSSAEEVSAGASEADAATSKDFGERGIYPTVKTQKLRAKSKPSATAAVPGNAPQKRPPLPAADLAEFDAGATPMISAQVNQQSRKYRQDQEAYQQKSTEARATGDKRIADETNQARVQQDALRIRARADVDAGREQWRTENQKIQSNFSSQSSAKHLEVDQQIKDKAKTADDQAEKELANAEKKAGEERTKAEAKAEEKKKEAQDRPKSWWERAKGAVSDAFDSIKGAINSIFDELRSLVKSIIDKAKQLVTGLIELARSAIVGLIKAFGEFVKGLVSLALAAFPEAAAKARAWIDDKVNKATAAVNQAAEALKAAAEAILDAVGAVLDAALAVLQAAFNAAFDALEFLAKLAVSALEALGKLVDLLTHFGAFLDGAKKIMDDPSIITEGIKTQIGSMIAEVPSHAASKLEEFSARLGGEAKVAGPAPATAAAKSGPGAAPSGPVIRRAPDPTAAPPAKRHVPASTHLKGIWRHLTAGLDHLKSSWWEELKKVGWNLLWPWPAVWGDLKDIWKQIKDVWAAVKSLKASEAIDGILTIGQKINSILGNLYGWFFIASVLIGTIIGAFFGGAGAVPGFMAGVAFASEVGEGLLVGLLAVEGGIIVKGIADLVTGNDSQQKDEADYDKIAGSTLTLAITGAMMVIGEIAAKLAKSVWEGATSLFKGEKAPGGDVKVDAPESKGAGSDKSAEPDQGRSGTEPPEMVDGERVVGEADDGHVKVTESGRCLICSTCEEISVKFRDELKVNKELRERLENAKTIEDPQAKAGEVEKLEKDLSEARQKAREGETPEQKTKGLSDVRTQAKSAIEEIRKTLEDPENLGKWKADPRAKADLDAKLREVDKMYEDAVKGAEDISNDPELTDLAREEFDNVRTKAEMLKSEVDSATAPEPDLAEPRPGLKYPQNMLPTGGDYPYRSPRADGEIVHNPRGEGYQDAKGDVWIVDPTKARVGKFFEWDVQHPDGTHTNVGSDGTITH
jgi:hypothetical protein